MALPQLSAASALFPDLPGADPKFHPRRSYSSAMTYKGKQIIAYHATCRDNKCTFSSAWASRDSMNAGFWAHRAAQVIDARYRYFTQVKRVTPLRAQNLVQQVADKHSHTYDEWRDLAMGMVRVKAGVDAGDLPIDYPYQRDYEIGTRAIDTALNIIQENFR